MKPSILEILREEILKVVEGRGISNINKELTNKIYQSINDKISNAGGFKKDNSGIFEGKLIRFTFNGDYLLNAIININVINFFDEDSYDALNYSNIPLAETNPEFNIVDGKAEGVILNLVIFTHNKKIIDEFKLKASISHELNHINEEYQLNLKNKSSEKYDNLINLYETMMTDSDSFIKYMGDVIYSTLFFERNASVTELYYELKRYNKYDLIKNGKELILKTSVGARLNYITEAIKFMTDDKHKSQQIHLFNYMRHTKTNSVYDVNGKTIDNYIINIRNYLTKSYKIYFHKMMKILSEVIDDSELNEFFYYKRPVK